MEKADHMEQLFNPQLPGGGHPDIQLCIFPHLAEFLVIDSREANPQMFVLNTEDVFNEEFFRTVESGISDAVRSSSGFLFSHLINLPIVIDETVRDIAMTFILDRIGLQLEDEDEMPSVVVYVVSGGALAAHTGRVLDGLNGLIHSSFNGLEADWWEHAIAEMVQRESAILQKLNTQQVAEALKSDSPDYFSLWESRN